MEHPVWSPAVAVRPSEECSEGETWSSQGAGPVQMYISPSPEDFKVKKNTAYSAYTWDGPRAAVACGNHCPAHLRAWNHGIGGDECRRAAGSSCLSLNLLVLSPLLFILLSVREGHGDVPSTTLSKEDVRGWEESQGAVTKREGGVH